MYFAERKTSNGKWWSNANPRQLPKSKCLLTLALQGAIYKIHFPCLDQIIIYIEVWSCVSVVAQVLKKPHIEKKDVNDKGNAESNQDFGSATGKTRNSVTVFFNHIINMFQCKWSLQSQGLLLSSRKRKALKLHQHCRGQSWSPVLDVLLLLFN